MIATGRPPLVDHEELRRRARESGLLWEPDEGSPARSGGGPARSDGHEAEAPVQESFGTFFTTELAPATLYGPDAMVLTAGGEVILDSVGGKARLEAALRRTILRRGVRWTFARLRPRRRPPEPRRRFELACSLSSYGHANYYHWSLELLPKLRGVEAHERRTGERPTLILPRRLRPYMTELLELAGHGGDPQERWSRDEAVVERLIMPSFSPPTPDSCRWLRQRILSRIDAASSSEPPRRILISRLGATARGVTNEEELAAALEPLGFRRLKLEELSVAEQALTFSLATTVVASHGAGLANLVYGPPGTGVLELFGDDIRPHYAWLTRITGARYRRLACEPQGRHLRADVGRVLAAVEALEERRDA